MTEKLPPIHPGKILLEEFLEPMGISQYRLAKATHVPPRRINEIVLGKRAITPDTALRLSLFFGLSERFWINLQARYDMEVEKDRLQDQLKREVQAHTATQRTVGLPLTILEETMEYVQLGRTGLKVSRLCLGTMNFGPHTTEPDSFVMMDKALDLGINFFDTANVYGWKKGEGVTEQIVGRWFAQGGGRREKVILATKVFGRMGDWPNQSRLSARHIREAVEGSLKRLQTDYIDLYQMHHIDRNTPWEEIWQAMEMLVQQGKILYVGSSNFAGWHIAQAQEAAKARHFMGLSSEQCLYSLNDRMSELEVLPACQEYGLGVIPWSPLSGGLLGGVLEKIEKGRRASDEMQKEIEEKRDKLEKWEAFCKEMGEQPADVALAWVLKHPAVTAPIIGPRRLQQLTGSLRSLKIRFKKDELKKLDEIWPGPGGEAPEAYAW